MHVFLVYVEAPEDRFEAFTAEVDRLLSSPRFHDSTEPNQSVRA